MPPAEAMLTAGDPVKNARAILRNALPVDNKPIRKVAQELESITESLRIPGKGAYGPVSRAVKNASKTFASQQSAIIQAFADNKKSSGTAAVASLTTAFKQLEQVSEAKGDKGDIFEYQQECLRYVGDIEEAMVKEFPFAVCFPYHPYNPVSTRQSVQINHTGSRKSSTNRIAELLYFPASMFFYSIKGFALGASRLVCCRFPQNIRTCLS
jgi:hypothetical protein